MMALQRMRDPADKPAYFVVHKNNNSAEWGPQKRKRVFIVASKLKGRTSVDFQWPQPPRRPREIGRIFDDVTIRKSYKHYKLPKMAGARTTNAIM